MQAFIEAAAPHAQALHVEAWRPQTRTAFVVTFVLTPDAAEVHVPRTAVGASTRASVLNDALKLRQRPALV